MPRFDGTGPAGEGPMSGLGGGYCIVDAEEAKRTGRRFLGLGRGARVARLAGRGRGFGLGGGRGRRGWL